MNKTIVSIGAMGGVTMGVLIAMVGLILLASGVSSALYGAQDEGGHQHPSLEERLEQMEAELEDLNDRLDAQAGYIRELRERLKKIDEMLKHATKGPQTDKEYAIAFSIMRDAHGRLAADHYTLGFNQSRQGMPRGPLIRPRP